MLQWESPHELNALRVLDATPDVIRFREQPLVVTYLMDGVERLHYPDIEVVTTTANELWEVKTVRDATNPDTERRTDLMERFLPAFGYTYRMVVAEELASGVRLSNALELLRFGRRDVSVLERERLRRHFTVAKAIAWGDILAGLLGPGGRAAVSRLLLEGKLSFQAGQRLTSETLIYVATTTASWSAA